MVIYSLTFGSASNHYFVLQSKLKHMLYINELGGKHRGDDNFFSLVTVEITEKLTLSTFAMLTD